jgi:hypothetical protein
MESLFCIWDYLLRLVLKDRVARLCAIEKGLAPIAVKILLRRGSAQKIETYSGKSSKKKVFRRNSNPKVKTNRPGDKFLKPPSLYSSFKNRFKKINLNNTRQFFKAQTT